MLRALKHTFRYFVIVKKKKKITHFIFKVTPDGTPITIAAPTVLLSEIFLSQLYSTIAPKVPNLGEKK